MTSSKEYKNYVVDQLSLLDNIICKSMMGGYLFYYNCKLFGGIYSDYFLVKIVDTNKKYNMKEQLPYPGAKMMYLVDCIDDKDKLKQLVIDTCESLEVKNKK